MDAILADDVRRFLYYLKVDRNLAPETVKNAHTGISAFYSWAETELGVAHVVRGRIQSPKANSRAINPLSRHEMRALMDACDSKAPWQSSKRGPAVVGRPTRQRDRAIVLTLLDTGLRAQELCDLVIGDEDIKVGAVQVRHGKGDKERVVYLGVTARETLWKYLSKRRAPAADEPRFETNRHRSLDTDALHNMLLMAGQRAEIAEPIHPHRMRHTFAITYLRNGGDVFTLQRLLGHSTMDMVKRYLSLATVDVEEAHRKAAPADNWRLG